jgi:hypothetical protein
MLRAPFCLNICCGFRYYWFNYETGISTTSVPAELSDDMVAELQFDSGSYFANTVTKEATWADPKETEWRQMSDPNGNKFWFHPEVRCPARPQWESKRKRSAAAQPSTHIWRRICL